ncbi:MAG: hypothetical protein OET81_12350 [Desulfobacteraceae bacterium]|nr:hypothetical protein [Desulfobacteraceae bacterium]
MKVPLPYLQNHRPIEIDYPVSLSEGQATPIKCGKGGEIETPRVSVSGEVVSD